MHPHVSPFPACAAVTSCIRLPPLCTAALSSQLPCWAAAGCEQQNGGLLLIASRRMNSLPCSICQISQARCLTSVTCHRVQKSRLHRASRRSRAEPDLPLPAKPAEGADLAVRAGGPAHRGPHHRASPLPPYALLLSFIFSVLLGCAACALPVLLSASADTITRQYNLPDWRLQVCVLSVERTFRMDCRVLTST